VIHANPSITKIFRITRLDWLLDLTAPERAFPPRPPTGPAPGVSHP
jgi:hypothetical protein